MNNIRINSNIFNIHEKKSLWHREKNLWKCTQLLIKNKIVIMQILTNKINQFIYRIYELTLGSYYPWTINKIKPEEFFKTLTQNFYTLKG